MGKRSGLRVLRLPHLSDKAFPGSGQADPPHGRLTEHHLVPSSRGGETNKSNLALVPENIHRAFHYLFYNMRPEEILALVATLWSPSGYFDFLLIRRGNVEIRLTAKDLRELQTLPPERLTVPNFDDRRYARWVRPVYRRPSRKRRTR